MASGAYGSLANLRSWASDQWRDDDAGLAEMISIGESALPPVSSLGWRSHCRTKNEVIYIPHARLLSARLKEILGWNGWGHENLEPEDDVYLQ